MPTAPKKVKRPWVIERKPFQRLSDNKKYQTYKWRVFSKRYKDNNPLCVMCDKKGITTASEVTDHIQRIEDGGSMYDENNLQALCKRCHNRKSGREAHGYKQE